MINKQVMKDQGLLTPENYQRGFLMGSHLLGGVCLVGEKSFSSHHAASDFSKNSSVASRQSSPPSYCAFLLCHTTGEYLYYRTFHLLTQALAAINQYQPLGLAYEPLGDCQGGQCEACQNPSCPPSSQDCLVCKQTAANPL